MDAVIICRVSTKEQEDGKSLDAQRERILAYCKRIGLNIIKEFEIVESSTIGARKQFNLMIDFIKSQNKKVVLVADAVDRVQRSFTESVLLQEMQKKEMIAIHFIREALIIDKDSRSMDVMMWDFAVMGAKSYVTNLAENVKRSVDYKLKNGEWVGRAPAGYLNLRTSDDKSNIVVDRERAHLVKRGFELYATGLYSVKKVAKILKEEGLTNSLPPHNSISTAQIHNMLSNPFYYGEMKCKGKLYAHKYEPIINKWLFDKCEAIRDSYNRKSLKYSGKSFALKGLVKCAYCKCTISFYYSKEKVYGFCSKYRGNCNAISVKENDLLSQLKTIFKQLMIPKEILLNLKEQLQKSNEAEINFHKNALETLRSEYDRIQKKLGVLLDMKLDESITQNEYDKKASELKQRQYQIDERCKQHTKADESYRITVSYLLDLCSKAPELFENSKVEYKNQLINLVLSNVQLKGKKLLFNLKSPFDVIVKASKVNDWLLELDSNQ